MQRSHNGKISHVKGAPLSRSYRSIDLGHDSDGELLLTYQRCDAGRACKILWNDLDGRRATYRRLALPGCEVTTVPAQWRTRVAYGLFCSGSAANRRRSGLYVKSGSRAPRRLSLPRDAVRFGADEIGPVDLRSTRVAAVAADIYEYSFSQTVGGRDMWSFLAAASEGESDAHARGLALGRGNVQWTLTNATHTGDPNETIIFRLEGSCLQLERLVSPVDSQEFRATDLAVDGTTMYLLVPGVGIVTHEFAPAATPTCE